MILRTCVIFREESALINTWGVVQSRRDSLFTESLYRLLPPTIFGLMDSVKKSKGHDNLAFDMQEQIHDQLETKADEPRWSDCAAEENRNKPTYCVTDVPPWYLCIFLAIQHYLTAFGGIISIPLILSEGLCLQHDTLTQGLLINTIFFVSGLCTILQVTFGVRLPILQGGTFALVTPAMAVLSMPEWKCPAWTQNASLVNTSSPAFMEEWQSRMRTLQGSIMVASLLQILVGFSGLIGFLMRFIGPLTIAPTVSLIGLALFDSAGVKAGSHWGISALTMGLIVVFSQYLRLIPLPIPSCCKTKKRKTSKFYIFQTMPILLGIAISWLVCYLLTIFDVLPSDSAHYGYLARTDVKGNVVSKASWFTLPYPGRWGVPTVNLAAVVGILAGIVCSMAESVGDYHACARLSGAPPPPKHAISRGIGVEGIGSLLAGAFGTGNGTTSFSENVAALGITKFTDMNSSRNIFVFGFSIFAALVIPNWIMKNPGVLETGVKEVDQVLHVLFTTHMFVGGFLGCFLDNTIPGTKRERGILTWNAGQSEDSSDDVASEEVYSLPFGITPCLQKQSWVRYVPFCPPNKPESGDGTPQGTEQMTRV
ncbi:solute carrier family 23 member 2-like isoform X2 [Poeciliopsis prolifica]|uniref:solute carrier family 23 member 2-like isoform X2 n=1 Tax=Poeciliopsis prolifica TaxID=188132 RepID=UPI002413862E|nr:solute carrier family 23 member 2-like isoform X2 [Poeciliopsis prolifica]